MRTLLSDETYYIDCDGKGLSWKGWRQQYNAEKKNYFQSDDQNKILIVMKGINEKRPEIKNIVIDTANSIMIADERRRSKEKTYDKWADLAWAVYDIATTASRLRDDLNVIVLFHTQTDTDDVTGDKFVRILTNGKKLNKIGLEKYFTTVLYSKSTDDGFVFETKAKNSTAKVPLGAFETETVPNDMQSVLDALKEY